MATPPQVSENTEVASHYATQAALTASLFAALRQLPGAPTTDPSPEYLAMVAALVNRYSVASISTSADYYDAMRELADVRTAYSTPIVDAPSAAATEAAILAALADPAVAPDLGSAEAVQNLIEGITQTLVMDAGRDEVWTALENDIEAKGWARVTRPGACAFCRMLATRGAVYKTERSASFAAHSKGPNGGGDCQCMVEPLFAKTYEPAAHVRADQVLWSETTSDTRGSTNKLNAFRRAADAQRRG